MDTWVRFWGSRRTKKSEQWATNDEDLVYFFRISLINYHLTRTHVHGTFVMHECRTLVEICLHQVKNTVVRHRNGKRNTQKRSNDWYLHLQVFDAYKLLLEMWWGTLRRRERLNSEVLCSEATENAQQVLDRHPVDGAGIVCFLVPDRRIRKRHPVDHLHSCTTESLAKYSWQEKKIACLVSKSEKAPMFPHNVMETHS